MPIRMEQDPDQGRRNQPERDPREPRQGGSNPLMKILPFVLMFLFKKPKLLIPVLVIGALLYFFAGDFFGGGEGGDVANDTNNVFSSGATLDPVRFDSVEVYEALAYGSDFNRLPSATSLLRFAPKRGYQGEQGSCVGWASAYAARTILHAQASGQNPNSVAFSPAFLFNHIKLNRNCQGSYMKSAMDFMHRNGALPMSEFPYDPNSCRISATQQEAQRASAFRTKGFQRLTKRHDDHSPDIMAIKQHLAQGGPVTIGMQVGGSFMQSMVGRKVWQPTRADYAMRGYGGHAMCVIGYDDNLQGGALQIMNSWGRQWGQDGVGWVKYKDIDFFVKEAYGLYPMGKAVSQNTNKLDISFGLAKNGTRSFIPLQSVGKNVFRTRQPIQKGDKFKAAITNNVDCYIYVFGQETDGSSYVLFPYTDRHSPYCGITGTRLFPRDYSMKADNIGQTDLIAVVLSKKPLDYQRLNQGMSQARGNYAEKLNAVLGNRQIQAIQFQAGEQVSFKAEVRGQQDVVGIVVAIDKR